MAISAKDVMELRKQTDCGMMECKQALTQADGDFEKAFDATLGKSGNDVPEKPTLDACA